MNPSFTSQTDNNLREQPIAGCSLNIPRFVSGVLDNSLNNILHITNTCAHHIIEDLIDITPDHSKYVYYCEKCYECFTSKEYIESTK
jgi:hypothetical protein